MTFNATIVLQQATLANLNISSLSLPSETIDENLISDSLRHAIGLACGTFFIPLIFLLGSASNIVSLAIFLAQGLRDSTNLILAGLAVSDFLFIASHSIPQMSYFVFALDEGLATSWRISSTVALQDVSFAAGRISALFVCLIVSERYVVVVFPLHAPNIVTKFRVRLACALIYLVTCGASVPFFVSTEIYYSYSPTYRMDIPASRPTAIGSKLTDFLTFYKRMWLTVTLRIVPVFYVMVMTAGILWSLRKSRLWRQSRVSGNASRKEGEEMRLTRTLVSVCLVYTASSLPSTIYIPCMYLVPGFNQHGKYKNLLSVVYLLTSVVEMIHSSTTFLLYISTSKKFSATLHQMCLREKAEGKQRAGGKPDKDGSLQATLSTSGGQDSVSLAVVGVGK